MSHITYPPVEGVKANGDTGRFHVGDLVTGKDSQGRWAIGKVIATHAYYPSVTIDGILMGPVDQIVKARSQVKVKDILTHERAPVSIGQNR